MATMQRQLGDHLPRWSHFMYDVELVELNFTNRLSMVEPLLNRCFCVCFVQQNFVQGVRRVLLELVKESKEAAQM